MMWTMALRLASRRSLPLCESGRMCSKAPPLPRPPDFLPPALQLLREGDHLQLAAGCRFLELLEIQDLLLQLTLGLLQIAGHLLVFAHVTQDSDGPDHPAGRVAQRGGVE